MPTDTSARKAAQTPAPPALSKRELAVQAIAARRAELVTQYEKELAAWNERKQAEINRIRGKLRRPEWVPHTPFALEHIGKAPENPLALLFWKYPVP